MTTQDVPRVLLIAPRYFGYEKEISDELVRQGMEVDALPDRPFDAAVLKAILRFRPELIHWASRRFFEEKIRQFGRPEYAIILVIQGEGLTGQDLVELRSQFPKAKMAFHTWDSLENKPFAKKNLRHYDHCSTFDPVDAKRYGLRFRPLFYSPGFDRPAETQFDYDLSFIGTVHSDRYRIVKSLAQQLPETIRTFFYLYLQASWMYDVRQIFTDSLKGANRSEFQFVPLAKDVVQATFRRSHSVLDIEHPNQRGVTMRTIEAVGSRRKMVTTNESIRDYDFFDPRNIHVVDRKRPRIDPAFFGAPYAEIPAEIRQRYALCEWVKDVCDLRGTA